MVTRARWKARASRFPSTVDIYQNEPTTHPDGQPVETESHYCRRFARVMPGGGQEQYRSDAMQTQADASHRVLLRYDRWTKQITPRMWVRLADGTRLDILRVVHVDHAYREIELECRERT